eukprot:CAMPEP_0201571544 /NCGR_PEP_ID=MMETSP0190_2-20130828/14388_1 /ASSEMBLY_ACC=CAM_ASM_000263 /TAXON_ID=37353 /ORGANISM="Rosalina sp." /LENGTH=1033 /DNA_ID=CAMNT_0047996325 /DNA_START=44 /DNA_END=3145 /DNA_ORIENTATION=+
MLSRNLNLLRFSSKNAANRALFVNRTTTISTYCDRHIGPQSDRNDYNIMLERVGYKSMDGLLEDTIPSHIRLSDEEMNEMSSVIGRDGKSESDALKELKDKMSNNICNKSYIGMGYYDTLTPTPILRNIIENPSWYTPYTPYQAEIAQGRLEMLLNFQTMIKDIVGKEISNASLLDESTACAEAMTMCLNMSKKKFKDDQEAIFLVSENCHPQNIAVIKQRAEPVGIKINVISDDKFESELKNNADLIFGAIIQYPNTYGNVYNNLQSLVDLAHNNGISMIASTDLFACSVLKPPGEYGIDIVVGSAQRFGVPLGYGGPHAAFLACDDANVRKMPGRLIGITKDSRNKPALRMALQTREQFIRRDKATSNICTAQALLANVAAAYGVYHGPNGIKSIAQKIHLYTKILSNGITQKLKCCENMNKVYFDTVTFKINPNTIKNNSAQTILNLGYENGVNFRPIDEQSLSISIDETTSLDDINKIFEIFNNSMNNPTKLPNTDELIEICENENLYKDDNINRTTPFMQHETFNTHHCETAMMRYLYDLERRDLGLNTAMIPLGSCTMKLNSASVMIPVTWNTVNNIHPFAPQQQTKGYESLIREMEDMLASVTGFDAISLQPNSGAAGEYTGLLTIREYHKQRGEEFRNICLIPTSAHGTNPASAAMCGYKIVAIKCDSQGYIDMVDLKQKAEQHANELGACMITYPSTHGVFEDNIIDLCDIIHKNGGMVYMDGANLQAQLTKTSPGKIGADVCHLNLHKTFCIPHGGGGPGLGPIGVNNKLKPYLPSHPIIDNAPNSTNSIGPISAAPFSSASILTIPWMYIKMMGFNGLEKATATSILAANYMAKRLENHYKILYRRNGLAAHEFIIDCRHFYKKTPDSKKKDDYIYKIEAEDIAKRLMDYSFHAPTMSWPVVNTLMVEPTESEPLEELDRFCDAMIGIRKEIQDVEENNVNIDDSPLRHSPHTIDTVTSDDWNKKYSRKEAAVNPYKSYWPSVGRVNNPYGDLNKICACPSVEDLVKIQQTQEDAATKSIEN